MEGNPFQGTAFEQDWVDGFNAGLVAPNASITAPSPLTLEAQDSFNKGVQAGQMINAALEPPVPIEGGFAAVAEDVHAGLDVAGPLFTAFSKAMAAGQSVRPFLTTAGIEVLFNLVVLVAIWGPTRTSFFPDGVSARLEQIRQQIAARGAADDNLELFMAVCASSEHAATTSDPLFDLGVWHGLLRLQFAEAVDDANQHEHPSAVRIHRYQTSQPTLVEVLSPE